jgi:hypothetical protein
LCAGLTFAVGHESHVVTVTLTSAQTNSGLADIVSNLERIADK